jgi:hypothetical protein
MASDVALLGIVFARVQHLVPEEEAKAFLGALRSAGSGGNPLPLAARVRAMAGKRR